MTKEVISHYIHCFIKPAGSVHTTGEEKQFILTKWNPA